MELIRLKASQTESGYFTVDDVPDENEWHARDPFDATACGLAFTEGGTDRTHESKSGSIKGVTCDTCKRIIKHYKGLR